MSDISIAVQLDESHATYRAAIKLPSLQYECFEPLKTTDDRVLAFALGELPKNDEKVKIIIKTREDASKLIAEALTELLLNAMKVNDTHNGYNL